MRTRDRGVTLIELMIVVAIIGILAAVAVFMFTKSKAKATANSEVNAMFAEFRLRQEQFHVENGSYLSTGVDDTDYHPAAPAGAAGSQNIAPLPLEWDQLRMTPDKTLLACAYVVIAGPGGDSANIGATAQSFGLNVAPATNWFYVIAECDMNKDPATNSFYFIRSDTDQVQKRNPGK